jgi:beta-galactosidase
MYPIVERNASMRRQNVKYALLGTAVFVASLCGLLQAGERNTVWLDGTWDIDESVSPDQVPTAFRHQVPVPGLVHLSVPAFPDVDQFESYENHRDRVRFNRSPGREDFDKSAVGVAHQKRNYFWYRKAFKAPGRREVALLKINKAQFGAAVWLNGKKIGEHLGCFSPGYFDLTDSLRWNQENTLVIRVGAHPAALPATVPAGMDGEKTYWTPGIYDSVSLRLADNPVIESVQVAPQLSPAQILVQTVVRNYGAARTFQLVNRVEGRIAEGRVQIGAGEQKVLLQRIAMPDARLWTPESPNLYVLETNTGADNTSTRFGMREFRFDTATKRAYLNGRVYFLRGSNICFHRFMEDPKGGALAWNRAWAHKLLAEIPKRLHWNSFRICIGPTPEFWLDIADETGLILQYEFPVWGYRPAWSTQEMTTEYTEWMRDAWNHPSVAWWDACNETRADVLAGIIRDVRKLDLSNRAWDNGYNPPVAQDDPVEDHNYLFIEDIFPNGHHFKTEDLEQGTGAKSTNSPHPTGHAAVLNEYDWIWVNRDGTPTILAAPMYRRLLGENAGGQDVVNLAAYLWAGLTEYWRAHRNYAGVLCFTYLTMSHPDAYTGDFFQDIETLKLHPEYEEALTNAFSPVGVYLNFWQPRLAAGSTHAMAVSLVNDEYEVAQGRLEVSLEKEGKKLSRQETDVTVGPLGQQTYVLNLPIPDEKGPCAVKATLHRIRGVEEVVSMRKTAIE